MTDTSAAPHESNPTSPATSVASSASSWPVEELSPSAGEGQEAKTPTSPARSLVDSPPPTVAVETTTKTLAPLDTQMDDGVSVSSELEGETPTFATPATPTWSRTRLPVSDDDGEGLSPIGELPVDGDEATQSMGQTEAVEKLATPGKNADLEDAEQVGEVVVAAEVVEVEDNKEGKVEKPEKAEEKPLAGAVPPADEDAATPTMVESTPARPAFVLTRPTLAGENETVSITQPSTPSASVKNDDGEEDEPKKVDQDGPKKVDEDQPKEVDEDGKKDKEARDSLQINTAFLTETQAAGQFFASPTMTNNAAPNSAISPSSKTAAFFSRSFRVVSSPPRPGGAFITELSDVESVKAIRKRDFSPPPPKKPKSSSKHHRDNRSKERREREQRSSQSTDPSTRPLISPPDNEPLDYVDGRRDAGRPAPFARRPDERFAGFRARALYSAAHCPARRDTHSDTESDSDAGYSRYPSASFRRPQAVRTTTSASRTIVSSVPPAQSHLRHQVPSSRAVSPPPPQPSRPPEHDREPEKAKPLEVFLRELKATLEREPTAYYAVKGVLAEFGEQRSGSAGTYEREHRRTDEREHRKANERRRELQHSHSLYHDQSRHSIEPKKQQLKEGYVHPRPAPPPPRPVQRRREPEHEPRRVRPVPQTRYSLTQTSDEGSETEKEAEKAKPVKPAAAPKLYQYKPPAVPQLSGEAEQILPSILRAPQVAVKRDTSPSPPCYPTHLSPRQQQRRELARPAPSDEAPLVRPAPVRPHPLSSVPSSTRVEAPDTPRSLPLSSKERAETLTIAQAAKLAAGLGDERQAEQLRKSGLKAKDKVSKLGAAPAENQEKKRDKDRAKEEKTHRLSRRHSFDSVVDVSSGRAVRYGRVKEKAMNEEQREKRRRAKKEDKVKIPVDLGLATFKPQGVSTGTSGRSGKEKTSRSSSCDIDPGLKLAPLKSALSNGTSGPPSSALALRAGEDSPHPRFASSLFLSTGEPGAKPVELAATPLPYRRRKSSGEGVYPSPILGNGELAHGGRFFFGGTKSAGAKAKGKEREGAREKRKREQSYPQGPVARMRVKEREDSAGYDFDDFA
ncbi:hypothetical protein JCM10213_000227 [Rhodosporidiobolus nylandii]